MSDIAGHLFLTAPLVGGAVAWYVAAARAGALRSLPRAAALLILPFLFFTAGAVVIGGVAVWRAREKAQALATWAVVDAVVVTTRSWRPMTSFAPTVYTWDSRSWSLSSDWLALETVWRYTAPGGAPLESAATACCTTNAQTAAK